MIDEKDQLINNLENEVRRLRDENKKLEETVQWMHDLIWQMVEKEKNKRMGRSPARQPKSLRRSMHNKKGLSRKRNPATAYKQTSLDQLRPSSGGLIVYDEFRGRLSRLK